MLSAREMAGFLTALLHAWLLLQGGDEKKGLKKGPRRLKMVSPPKKPGRSFKRSLDLHAEQLQQRGEDPHLVEQEDVVSGPAEDVRLAVALVERPWVGRRRDVKRALGVCARPRSLAHAPWAR